MEIFPLQYQTIVYNNMIDENIRLKRKLLELEEQVGRFNILFEYRAVRKHLSDIERLGKLVDFDAKTLDTLNLRNAVSNLKTFVQQVETSDDFKEELEKENE